MPAAAVTPPAPKGAKSDRLSESQPVMPTAMKSSEHADLDDHHRGVDLRRLARAADQQQRAQDDEDDRRQVDDAVGLGGVRDVLGDREAEQVVEQLVEVLRPADRHGGRRDAVLEQQAGRDDHRDPLAHRRVGVRVRGARDGHRARQLGVADGRQAGDHAREHEREDHRRAGLRHRRGEDDEDAGADRRADAEQRQLEQADRALELASLRVRAGLLRHRRHRLAPQELLPQ